MIKVLVDTDIIIDFLRTRKGILSKLFELQAKQTLELYITSITIVELFSGQSSKKKNPDLSELISEFKIIELTRGLAKFAGELKRDNLLLVPFADLVIGTTAVYIKAKLATRNRQHFQSIPKLKFY